jgi:hypothetical protein
MEMASNVKLRAGTTMDAASDGPRRGICEDRPLTFPQSRECSVNYSMVWQGWP